MSRKYLTEEELCQAAEFSDEEEVGDCCDDDFLINTDESEEEDIVYEDSDVEDIFDCNDDELVLENEVISPNKHPVTKDKTIWFCDPQISGKTPAHNIIKGAVNKIILPPGKMVEEPIDSFRLYMNESVVNDIVMYTNQEAIRVLAPNNIWKPVDAIEMEAFFGLLLTAGHMNAKNVNTKRLWSKLYGPLIFRATMSEKRFKLLLRFIRFDDKNARSARRETDKLAAIRDIWEAVNKNLNKYFMPGETITVDEQLIGFKGRCPFKQYIPSKPDKYGMKIFWVNDSATGYPLSGLPYLGKENGTRAKPNLGERVVENLCAPYYGTNRNVTCDNYFTTLQLANNLKRNGLTLVGTLRKNKPYIPSNFLANRSRENYSSIFGFTKHLTLVSYVPRKGKAVLLLSTMHHHKKVEEELHNKPEIIVHYNATKGGTDVMDQMAHGYSCKRRTNRWPFTYFMNLLDICGIASYIMYTKLHPNWNNKKMDKRHTFLEQVAEDMTKSHMLRRAQTVRNKNIVQNILQFNQVDNSEIVEPPSKKIRSKCHLCPVNRKIFQVCAKCKNNVCKDHSEIICKKCMF